MKSCCFCSALGDLKMNGIAFDLSDSTIFPLVYANPKNSKGHPDSLALHKSNKSSFRCTDTWLDIPHKHYCDFVSILMLRHSCQIILRASYSLERLKLIITVNYEST